MNDFDLRKYMSNNSLHQSNIGGFSITELQQTTKSDFEIGLAILNEIGYDFSKELLTEIKIKDLLSKAGSSIKDSVKALAFNKSLSKDGKKDFNKKLALLKKLSPSKEIYNKFLDLLKSSKKTTVSDLTKLASSSSKKQIDEKWLTSLPGGVKKTMQWIALGIYLLGFAQNLNYTPNQIDAANQTTTTISVGDDYQPILGDVGDIVDDNAEEDIKDIADEPIDNDLVNDFGKYLASDVDDDGFEFWMDNGVGDVDNADIQDIIDQAIKSLKSKFPNLKKITLTDNATWTNTQGDDASDDKALDGGSVSKDRQDTANKINKLLKKAIEDNFEGADVTHVEKDAVKDTSKEYKSGSLDAKKQQKVGSTWSDIESGDDKDITPDDTGDDDVDVDEGDLIFPSTDKIWFANKRPESVKTKYEVVFMQILPSLIGGGEPEFYKNDEFKEILKYVGTIKGEKQSFSEKFIKDRIDPNGVLQQALKDPKYKNVKDKIQNTINALDWVKFSTKNPSTLGNLFKKLDPNIKLGSRKANKALPGKAGQAAKQPGTKSAPSGKSFDTNLRETVLNEIKSILFEKYDIQNLSTFNKEAATDNLGLLVPLYSDTWGLASNDGVTGIEYDAEYLGKKYKNSLNTLKTIFPKVKTVVGKSVKLKDKETSQPKVKKEKEHSKSSRLAAIEKEIESKNSIQTILKLVDQTQEIDPFIFGLLSLISNKFENDKNKLRLIIQGALSKFNKQSSELAKSSKKKAKGGTKVGGFNYAEKADIKEDIKKPNAQVIKALNTLKKNPIIGPRLDQLVTTDEAINLITDIFFDLDDSELKIFPNASPAEIKQGLERALKLFQSDKEIQSSFNNKTADDQSKGLDVFYKGYTSTSSDYKVKEALIKKYIKEALTPDEASKVDAKYKEIYAGMVGKNPLKMKKYDNPDKVAYGRAINLIQKESLKLAEKLGKKAKVGDYIEDFTDSDAPQFKGKSDKKKKQMAVAAFLNKEEQKLDEIDAMMEDAQEKSEKNYSNYFKKMDKNRLNELVKAALMGPISEKETFTDKYDDNPGLKGKQKNLPDALQKGILGLEEDNLDEAEVNEMKMMDFAKLAKKVKNSKEFIKKIADILGNQSPDGEKALERMYDNFQTLEESKEETLSERIFKELRK